MRSSSTKRDLVRLIWERRPGEVQFASVTDPIMMRLAGGIETKVGRNNFAARGAVVTLRAGYLSNSHNAAHVSKTPLALLHIIAFVWGSFVEGVQGIWGQFSRWGV